MGGAKVYFLKYWSRKKLSGKFLNIVRRFEINFSQPVYVLEMGGVKRYFLKF